MLCPLFRLCLRSTQRLLCLRALSIVKHSRGVTSPTTSTFFLGTLLPHVIPHPSQTQLRRSCSFQGGRCLRSALLPMTEGLNLLSPESAIYIRPSRHHLEPPALSPRATPLWATAHVLSCSSSGVEGDLPWGPPLFSVLLPRLLSLPLLVSPLSLIILSHISALTAINTGNRFSFSSR